MYEYRHPIKYLLNIQKENPQKIIFIDSNRAYSSEELLFFIKKAAGYFKDLGIVKDDKIALYTNDYFELIVTMFGLWCLEAVCIPMNTTQPEDKINIIESIIKPDYGFYHSSYITKDDKGFMIRKIDFSNLEQYDIYKNESIEDSEIFPGKRTAMVMFTSGTSGIPKGVEWSFKAMVHNALNTGDKLGIRETDRIFVNSPPYTTSSISHILTMFFKQASICVNTNFLLGDKLIDSMNKNRCNGFGGVPAHFTRILGALESGKRLDDLRFLMNSGDHLPVTVIERIKKVYPRLKILCVYGLTEVAGRYCILRPDMLEWKLGSVGKPLDGMDITIRDENSVEVEKNEIGQVFISGLCLMDGYYNNPVMNAVSMTDFGFATGDYGFLDEEGYLFLKGRKDDIMKVGGEKVSVKMIEERLINYGKFKDFMVSSIQDKYFGMVPCLYYMLFSDQKFNKKDLLRYLKKNVPENHIPMHFYEVEKINRTGSGKIIRSDVFLKK